MNRRRKAGQYTKPAGRAPGSAPLPEAPAQAARRAELLMICALGGMVHFGFRALLDGPGTEAIISAFARPAISRKALRELDAVAGPEDDDWVVRTPLLLAAAGWFCALRLPRSLGSLWGGPPLRARTDSGSRHPGSQDLGPSRSHAA